MLHTNGFRKIPTMLSLSSLFKFKPSVSSLCSVAVAKSKETYSIRPPKKKYLTEFTLLKSLAATVPVDPTGYVYGYIDSGKTSPSNKHHYKWFLMAKGSGKEAAHYMLKNYPNLFAGFRLEDPANPNWRPLRNSQEIIDSTLNDEISSNDGLSALIDLANPEDAWHLYQEVKKKENVDFSTDVMHRLLDLLCVTNGVNPELDLSPEIVAYSPQMFQEKMPSWKRQGPAEQLFNQLPHKTDATYRSMIRGSAKFQSFDRAMELYGESSLLALDLPTINALLRCVRGCTDKKIATEIIVNLFETLKKQSICPDIVTFTNTFYSLGMLRIGRCYLVDDLIKTMKHLKLIPTFGTYSNLLKIYYPLHETGNEAMNPCYLSNILDEIEQRDEAQVVDMWEEAQMVDDFSFFNTALTVATECLNDFTLVRRIHNLLNRNCRLHMLGDADSRTDYTIKYIKFCLDHENLNNFMSDFLKYIVVFHVTPSLINSLFSKILIEEEYHYLKDIWNTLMAFGRYYPQSELHKLIEIFLCVPKEREIFLEELTFFASLLTSEPKITLLHQCFTSETCTKCIEYCFYVGDLSAALRFVYLADALDKDVSLYMLVKLGLHCAKLNMVSESLFMLTKLYGAQMESKEAQEKIIEIIQIIEDYQKNTKSLLDSQIQTLKEAKEKFQNCI